MGSLKRASKVFESLDSLAYEDQLSATCELFPFPETTHESLLCLPGLLFSPSLYPVPWPSEFRCKRLSRRVDQALHQVARMSEARSGRSRPNALRVWLVSGTPSEVTSCRRLSVATKGGQNPDVASLIRATRFLRRSVTRGLDPRVHLLRKTFSEVGWIAGSSPAMTGGSVTTAG
jgi:hypothetical protein